MKVKFVKNALLYPLFLWSLSAFSQELKPPMLLKLKGKGGEVELKLMFCPEGKLVNWNSQGPTIVSNISPFYMGETEITTAQFVSVMGESSISNNINTLNTLNHELKDTFTPFFNSNSTYPFLFVTPEQAIEFCLELQSAYDLQIVQGKLDVESRRFYIPTHSQWVYASRANSSEERARNVPHFFKWINTDQISQSDKNDLLEVWNDIKGDTEQLVFNQNQIMQIVNNEKSQKSSEKIKKFLTWALEQINGPGWKNDTLRRALDSPANPWGIRGIHDNGTEWTIKHSLEDRSNQWKNKLAEFDISKISFFLAGPALADSYSPSENRHGQLNKYTLWGGPLLSGNDFTGTAGMKYSQEFDMMGIKPSFRICSERVLTDYWPLAIRNDFWSQENPETVKASILEKQTRLKTFVAAYHECHPLVEYYAQLLDSKTKNTTNISKSIEVFSNQLPKFPNKQQTKDTKLDISKSNLNILIGDLAAPKEKSESETKNPDKDFFELLSKAVED